MMIVWLEIFVEFEVYLVEKSCLKKLYISLHVYCFWCICELDYG